MSTRCMVRVTSSGLPWEEIPQYLYHHCDGYPEYILPLLERAFNAGMELIKGRYARFNGTPDFWEMGRAGKVAGLICATDPLQFEPFPESNLRASKADAPYQSDLEYVYAVHIVNKNDHEIRWFITVYEPKNNKFWDDPSQKNLKQVGPKMKLAPGKEPLAI